MDPTLYNALREGLTFYLILVSSICVHEWGHAVVADYLGDPLPRSQGRVSLNPLVHIDSVGTVLIPLIGIFLPLLLGTTGLALIGWGRPVQISLPNRESRVRDDLLITAAGPLANVIIGLVLAIAEGLLWESIPTDFITLIQYGILINAALFCFNLIPIPPLDGSHFLRYAVGMSEETFMRFSSYGFIILIVLISIGPFRALLGAMIHTMVALFDSVALWAHSLLL